jgi:hypothetical protein
MAAVFVCYVGRCIILVPVLLDKVWSLLHFAQALLRCCWYRVDRLD